MSDPPLNPKSQACMPAYVRDSAWRYSPSIVARIARSIAFVLRWAEFWVLVLSALCGVGLLLVVGGGLILGVSEWSRWTLLAPGCAGGAVLLLAFARQRWAVALARPRAEHGYPLVDDLQDIRESFDGIWLILGALAIVYAAIGAGGVRPNGIVWIASTACATASVTAWVYARWMPMWGTLSSMIGADRTEGRSLQVADQQGATNRVTDGDYPVPVTAMRVSRSFADIHGMEAVKSKLHSVAEGVLNLDAGHASSDRNGVLLHGEPGNGKTVFAEALAGELRVPLITLTYGAVASKWLGEVPKVLTRTFAYAKSQGPCVLFIDEVDSFLRSRDGPALSSEDQKVTNTLLTEIVALRGHRVLLVAATNFLDRLDQAGIREGRFDFKIEVTAPDGAARLGLLRDGAARSTASLPLDEEALQLVAARWGGFSVSRLVAITKALPEVCATGASSVGFGQWMAALRSVQGRSGTDVQNAKALTDLLLPGETKESLDLLAARLRSVQMTHSRGGTLPSGVLFHGPSGTGKTAAAHALARDTGWALLAVAGPDLVAERGALDALCAKARDIQPVLVFIDEADDVLRNRQLGGHTEVVNKLLTVLDGGARTSPDIVFIAATNHPEQVDPAMLRTGRFSEKVEFLPPPAHLLPQAIRRWLSDRKLALEEGIEVDGLAEHLAGASMATVEGVLQYALNRAIHRGADDHTSPLLLSAEDLEAAVRVIVPGAST